MIDLDVTTSEVATLAQELDSRHRAGEDVRGLAEELRFKVTQLDVALWISGNTPDRKEP